MIKSDENLSYAIKNYNLVEDESFLESKIFRGAQVMYSWRQLEPKQGQYDFSLINKHIKLLAKHDKKLFIQLQDVSFRKIFKPVPNYILQNTIYGGGVIQQKGYNEENAGWAAIRWNPYVQKRFQMLLQKIAQNYDGVIAGINLQESALSLAKENQPNPKLYRDSLLQNMQVMARVFKKSTAM